MKKFTLISLILGLLLSACAAALPATEDDSLVRVYALAD